LSEAKTPDLVAAVNSLVGVRSIHGKVDIQFEDTSFATAGIAEKYRAADGSITLQRPASVYLVVQGPLGIGDVAQMTSDGEHFRIAVLKGDEKYKRFVRGTNNANYPKLDTEAAAADGKGKKETEKETVSALSNLRPQHLTDAFMVRPIETNGASAYAQSEFFQEEPDNRTQAKKGSRIMRGYYLLEEFSQPAGGDAKL